MYERENAVHNSSSIESYYQCGLQSTHSNVLVELFAQVISEPCFNILRTQEQLGMSVHSPKTQLRLRTTNCGFHEYYIQNMDFTNAKRDVAVFML